MSLGLFLPKSLFTCCYTLSVQLCNFYRCRCGNCKIELLENAKECQCCQEIEQCVDANNEYRVLEELGEAPACVTNHPGFKPVCLNPWTLELLADQYKTMQQARYRNLGSEKRQVLKIQVLNLVLTTKYYFLITKLI